MTSNVFDKEQLLNGPSGQYLINKLGINNNEELSLAEYKISSRRLFEILIDPHTTLSLISDKYKIFDNSQNFIFDENLFLAINYYLLSDIYYFAGSYKNQLTYAAGRGNASIDYLAMFNQLDAVESNLHYALVGMNNELKNTQITSKEYLAKKLADYFLTLVNIHPFREGNGRTIRTYFSLFIEYNLQNSYDLLDCAYLLDWSKIDENIFKNVIFETQQNPNILINEFEKALLPIPKHQNNVLEL